MRKEIFSIWIIFAFTSIIHSQDIDISKRVINNEINHLQTVYKNKIFMMGKYCKCADDNFSPLYYDIIHKDTIEFVYSGSVIIKIGVKLNESLNTSNFEIRERTKSDTLWYYLLKRHASFYYLFGFTTSDLLMDEEFRDLNNVKLLSEGLYEQNILNKKEAKFFFRSFKNKRTTYYPQVNKPCEILKYYYDDKNIYKAGTLILPYQPMIGYIIN